jgi:pyruvate ferredoxin oxidoreductase beta subunit
MCAGCAMTLFIRLVYIGMPNPEHTIVVGTAGCGRLAISQASVPFIYGNYGDTNAVASGLKRGLEIRFPNQVKDVVVMAGDGGLIDIGFQGLMHSWFRRERFTTIMLDNEVYGNTGGQESGMTVQGKVLKMAPRGKFGEKVDALALAKVAKVDYIARLAPTNPARVVRTIRRAIMVAREVGHSYVQAYTSCNIEYSIPTPDVLKDAFEVEKDRYGFEEYISPAAKEYLQDMGEKIKEKKQ